MHRLIIGVDNVGGRAVNGLAATRRDRHKPRGRAPPDDDIEAIPERIAVCRDRPVTARGVEIYKGAVVGRGDGVVGGLGRIGVEDAIDVDIAWAFQIICRVERRAARAVGYNELVGLAVVDIGQPKPARAVSLNGVVIEGDERGSGVGVFLRGCACLIDMAQGPCGHISTVVEELDQ